MRFLPKKIPRILIIIISVFLLGFISASFIFGILVVKYPRLPLHINFEYRFTYLNLNKKFITSKDIGGDRIFIYSERLDGKTVELINFDKLEAIIKKAYSDFPVFVTNKHGIIMPDKNYSRYNSLNITFVGVETFSSYDNLYSDGSPYLAFAQGNKIYIKSWNLKYNISMNESTIRHEIFHYLANKYRLAHFLPHADAKEFGKLKLINFP